MSFQLDQAVARIRQENVAYARQSARRRERARTEARRLAEVFLMADPLVTRVWGFGSAFEENRPFGPDSDLDIALEGGETHRLQLLSEGSEFVVELVDITGVEDPFACHIRAAGVLLGSR